MRLLNVARASLEELLLDFEDFLRQRHLEQWAPESPEAMAVRQVPWKFKKDRTDQTDLTDLSDEERWALYAPWLEHDDPAVRANALICLINQANYLLDQQIVALKSSSSRKAVTASNSLRPGSRSGIGRKDKIGQIRQIKSPIARTAENP